MAGADCMRGDSCELAFIDANDAPQGQFKTFSLPIFDSTGSDFLGQPLQIRLFSYGPQTAVDDLVLTAESAPVSVPEPGTLALLGAAFAGAGLYRRRKVQ